MGIQNVDLRPCPFKEKLYVSLDFRIRSHETHERNSAFFITQLQKRFSSHYHVEVKRDLEIPENMRLTSQEYSFVFSLGGDGTYMRAAQSIRDKNLPLIGVCSDSNSSVCGLRSIGMLDPDELKIQYLLDKLEDEDAGYEYRTRLEVKINRAEEKERSEE